MMIFLSLILPLFVLAQPPMHWSAALEIVDKHEFYPERKPITAPAETWQTLLAVTYVTRNLIKVKDCVNYRVPGIGPGLLKINTAKLTDDCSDFFFAPGDRELLDLKAVEFSSIGKGLRLTLSFPQYRTEKWDITLPTLEVPKAQMLMSSAEYKSPKVVLLAPATTLKGPPSPKAAAKLPCHNIDENCQELSSASCSGCEEGWYEIPNGCPQGPKFCGVSQCGQKNKPACRRGMKFQRIEKKFECRGDNSFAYCNPGLTLECEGNLPYCR